MSDETTHFGLKQVPIAEKAGKVAEVFHSVAGNYDVMNDLMSLGTHRIMKQIAVEMTAVGPGDRVMDLAGGTGDLTAKLSRIVGDEGEVILTDINYSMLSVGRDLLLDKGVMGNVSFLQADAENLPCPDNYFDAITIAFGLRNVSRKEAALESMLRILKPGGRLVVLEFSHPENPLLRTAYNAFSNLWPGIGKMVTGDKDSYQYLVDSIKVHPEQGKLKEMFVDAGYVNCKYHNLLNGIVAIHTGKKIFENARP